MIRSNLSSPSRSLLLCVALSVAVSACGEDKGGADTTGATTTAATSDATTAPTTTAPTHDATTAPTTTDATTDAPGDTTSTSGSSTDTGDPPAPLCPEHAAVDACCCFEATPADEPQEVDVVCPSDELCPAVEFECDDVDLFCTSNTEVALQCTLEALAAGKDIGKLLVHYDIGQGYGDTRIELYLQNDRTVYMVREDILDLGDSYSTTGRYDLKPSSYYQDCAALPSVDEQAKCLMEPIEAQVTEECIQAFYNDAL